jgi:cell division transport system ATP-binding protein
MKLLQEINRMGTTVLVVTHEKDLVNRFDKRVVAIENGRIISDGAGGYYNNER